MNGASQIQIKTHAVPTRLTEGSYLDWSGARSGLTVGGAADRKAGEYQSASVCMLSQEIAITSVV